MAKLVKYVLIGIAALLVLLVAAGAFIVATFDPNAYKPQIVQQVKDKTQRTLRIDGDIKLTFLPKLGADLGRLSLSERGSDREFAAVESASVSVAVLPLLSKQVVVDQVAVKGLRANFVRHKDGRTNLDDLLPRETPTPPAPGSQPAARADFLVNIERVSVDGAALTWRDEQEGRDLAITGFNLKTGRVADDVPTNVGVSFSLAGKQPAVQLDARLQTRLTFNLQKREYALDDIALEIKGGAGGVSNLNLSGNGNLLVRLAGGEVAAEKLRFTASGTRQADNFDLSLDMPRLNLTRDKFAGDQASASARITNPDGALVANLLVAALEGTAQAFRSSGVKLDLEGRQGTRSIKGTLSAPLEGSLEKKQYHIGKIAAAFTLAGPDLPGGRVSTELQGDVRVDGAGESVRSEFAGTLFDSRFDAKAALQGFAKPRISFNLDMDTLDLERLQGDKPQVKKPQATDKPAPARAGAAAEQPIDLSGIKDLNLDGSVKIGQLKAGNVKAGNVRLGIKAQGGRLTLNPMNAELYGGTVSGSAGAAAAAAPAFTAKTTLAGVSVGPLLRDLADNDRLEGTGNVTLDLAAQGATVSALKKALGGSVAVKLTDGHVKGVNVAQKLREAKATLATLRGKTSEVATGGEEKTDFSELSASFAVKNGVARNNDLLMKSPLLRLTGAGAIDVGNDRIDYDARVSVVTTSKGQGGADLASLRGITIPVRIAGPLDAPGYTFDFAALAKGAAGQALQRELQRRLGGKAGAEEGAEQQPQPSAPSPIDQLKELFRKK